LRQQYTDIYIADCTVSHPIRQLSEKIDVTRSKYKAPVSLSILAHPLTTFWQRNSK
jgi:hypothetical protein